MNPASLDERSAEYRPGARLRQARIERGRSLDEASAELKLMPRLLAALEDDDYSALPEPVFVRGFMRNYAEWLGLPADEITVRFDEFYQAETGRSPAVGGKANPVQVLGEIGEETIRLRTRRRRQIPIGWSALVLLVILSAGLLWQSGVIARLQGLAGTVAPRPAGQPTELTLPNTPTTPSSIDSLLLTLGGDSGVEVRDAGGAVLATGAHHAGETLKLSGQSPFSIELSKADAVRLVLNGEAVDLSPYTVNGVVNFRLSR